jgi:DNA-binding MarR family transcriptional regulator
MVLCPADIDALASALYTIPALRRDIQRVAGIEHAVSALAALGVVSRTGPARISEVAAELDISLSVASRRIAELEDHGLVERVGDPADGRCSLIAISPAGTEKLQAAHRRIRGALAAAVAEWSPDEVAGLAVGLVRLRIALSTDQGERATGDDRLGVTEAIISHRERTR